MARIWRKSHIASHSKYWRLADGQLGKRGSYIVHEYAICCANHIHLPFQAEFSLINTYPGGWVGGQNLIIQLSQPCKTGAQAKHGKNSLTITMKFIHNFQPSLIKIITFKKCSTWMYKILIKILMKDDQEKVKKKIGKKPVIIFHWYMFGPC